MRSMSEKILKLMLFAAIYFYMFNVFALEDRVPKFNMSAGVTPISKDIYELHMIVFSICVIIAVGVFTMLLIALIKHRKSRGAIPSQFHEHPLLEIAWAIIPFLILIIIAFPATKVLIRMYDSSDATITIKIVGYQWKWQYVYLDQGISFFSNLKTPSDQIYHHAPKDKWYLLEVDKPLVVPTHEKIRFLITANDVIHSWWVPALGVKKDAIPGFINEAWAKIEKPGIYRGQCAELCGVYHGFMPIVVEAISEEQFQQWIKQQQQQKIQSETAPIPVLTAAELMKLGKSAYNQNCAACHQENGMGIPPVYPPLRASSVAVGHPISRHIDIILNGIPGTAMQGFAKQLTDVEIAAIVTYERNAWDNKTGEVVQPQDVLKRRQALVENR